MVPAKPGVTNRKYTASRPKMIVRGMVPPFEGVLLLSKYEEIQMNYKIQEMEVNRICRRWVPGPMEAFLSNSQVLF
jgi:hypothetical protein